ncbi:MAG: hypothetical protein OER22_09950 [Gammaproteobacteria bacterium]|nr:hypothetical protein [Gammaproteobacteria bacterium]MDH3373312.1 hypothetical protein [Gammaproteobacteria bacterium]MDH3409827.1 hypothetical protein [Gammaproteobacteria bacterium]MDH3552922.1 hypothetical protein [Gammaproteobacteria bacterium]
MHYLVLAVGILIAVAGLFGAFSPAQFRRSLGSWSGQSRFWFAVLIRLVMGAVLLLVADELRFSFAMKILGGISVAAGIGVLLMGQRRLDSLVNWWLSRPDSLMRVSTALAAAFGVFLIYVSI